MTPQEAADALETRMRAVRAQINMPAATRDAAVFEAAVARLETGLEQANGVLTSEADAGRLATTDYRSLDDAITAASDVLARAAVQQVAQSPARRQLQRSAGTSIGPVGIISAASLAAVGLAWFLGRRKGA